MFDEYSNDHVDITWVEWGSVLCSGVEATNDVGNCLPNGRGFWVLHPKMWYESYIAYLAWRQTPSHRAILYCSLQVMECDWQQTNCLQYRLCASIVLLEHAFGKLCPLTTPEHQSIHSQVRETSIRNLRWFSNRLDHFLDRYQP